MAKVRIDENACVGCGLCVSGCPDSFELNDNGIAIVKDADNVTDAVKDMVTQCPVDAIIIDE